jgi:hypothetical protein
VKRAVVLLLAPVLGFSPHLAHAALPRHAQQSVDGYLAELSRVERARSRTSMERLFTLAMAVKHDLMTPQLDWKPLPLEELSEQEFAALQRRARGMILNRAETVFAVPDIPFFVDLGERKGGTEDRLFFRIYLRTYPGVAVPAYVRQQADYSGCTDFASGKLTQLYGEWTAYGRMHPKRYAAVVRDELGQIEDNLLRSTCACGPSRTVAGELRHFLNRQPGSQFAPKVRNRLNRVMRGTSRIRFNCASG